MMNVQSKVWTHNLFCPHSNALIMKPSPHVMTKNDITKDINTSFEQKNACFFYIIIWFNRFGRFIITLNFVFFLIYKNHDLWYNTNLPHGMIIEFLKINLIYIIHFGWF
jgi:hypothetical protein